MTSASLDRLLAVLVLALATTGLLSLRAGHPGAGWIFVVHGTLAGALAIAVVAKVRRSLPRAVGQRRWRRLALGLLVSLGAAAALSGGYVWVASGELVWLELGGLVRWTVLTLHAWIGLATVPLVVLHLLPTRWRLLRPGRGIARRAGARLLSRRSFAIGAGLAVAGLSLRTLADLIDEARGGERRFTGSRWLPAGGIPPATTFFGEPPPPVDPAAWRVRVGGLVTRPLELSIDGLRALGELDLAAVLDCTSGWAIETGWRGVPLDRLLEAAAASSEARAIRFRSATGWATELPMAEARPALLATAVAGEPLGIGNGAPVRLVVPDRRGLDWVKWVTEVEVV
jgi:DMSO/TMAO reductase YedYZ molybdopterin-dependent catalytic subunit